MKNKQTLGFPDTNLLAIVIFGLCPLVVKSTSLLSGLFIGVATLFVLLFASATVSLCRYFIPHSARLIFILLINASWVMVLDMLLQAYFYELRLQLGIYIPLLAVNVVILLIQEHVALREKFLRTIKNAIVAGLVLLLALFILGGLREVLATGGLFTDLYFLPPGSFLASIQAVYFIDNGFLLFDKTAGAFICFGLFIATVNYVREIVSTKRERQIQN